MTRQLTHRRWIGALIRAGLVVVAIVAVGAWFWQRAPRPRAIQVQTEAPVASSLEAGDAQIFSRDSAVNLILKGDQVLAGLSPQTVAKIRAEIDRSTANVDTNGLGGSIAQFVTKTVADKIGTHVVYRLADMRDIRYENDEIIILDNKGNETRLFKNVKVNNQPLSQSFPPEDAQRFIELVRARKRSLP